MKFEDILNEWDSITSKPINGKSAQRRAVTSAQGREMPDVPEPSPPSKAKRSVNESMQAWLNQYGVEKKDDVIDRDDGISIAEEAARLAKMEPEATLDLHGLTVEEGSARLHAFFESARRRGLEKVLVVHGKGNHSADEPVLRNMVKRELDHIPCAGRRAEAPKRLGGSGAVVVLIKRE